MYESTLIPESGYFAFMDRFQYEAGGFVANVGAEL